MSPSADPARLSLVRAASGVAGSPHRVTSATSDCDRAPELAGVTLNIAVRRGNNLATLCAATPRPTDHGVLFGAFPRRATCVSLNSASESGPRRLGGIALDIEIESRSCSPEELLAGLSGRHPGLSVEIPAASRRFRTGPDAAVVVAIISGGAAAIQALIAGVLALVVARRGGNPKIVIRSRERTIEFPADTPPEDIDQLVDLVRRLDDPAIELP